MRCGQVKELLSAYLDNMLALEESHSIRTHLRSCKTCNDVLTDFHDYNVLLRQLPYIAPDARLHHRIFTSAEYYELMGTSWTRWKGDQTTSSYCLQTGTQRPYLIILPGKDHFAARRAETPISLRLLHQRRRQQKVRLLSFMITIAILLSLLISGWISWHFWFKAGVNVSQSTTFLKIPFQVSLPTNIFLTRPQCELAYKIVEKREIRL